MRVALGAAVLAALVPLAACGGGDPTEDYCAAVEEHQERLTEIAAEGGPTALLDALGPFRDLSERAPRDVRDEWEQVVGSLEALDEALADADVDPAAYDGEDPPPGLGRDERARIEAAAEGLVSPATAGALDALQQQSRDVCQTPLSR
ncbi:hypothetical protein [Nocardioides dongkuii]|uniref:hypothetical protein n=1 Tax=Nocardioides dongkuii TaxID=2760089 RepID=UPI0015FA523E|nr:hypothetical protein [Nocardioides dongkuii]